MHTKLHKKSILKKTAQVGISLLISKFMGIAREVLQVSYLGVGPLSDAFSIAFKIPNMLRKIFAEGALSAALIPSLVKIIKKEGNTDQASKLISLTYMIIGAIILLLCFVVVFYPNLIIFIFAPGFSDKAVELVTTINLIRILIFFIFFIFSSALLASAMQAINHFAVPSWGPAILNIVYIGGLLIAIKYGLSVEYFALFLLSGALLQLIIFAIVYLRLKFKFLKPDLSTFNNFKDVMVKFIPCILSVSAMEVQLIIDARFASNLPAGSVTLINISSRFMSIALGAFAVAFSAILLPHFSKISTYAPKRLSFYLLESAKFIFWLTMPIVILMSFFSYDIFYTLFYKLTDNFTLEQVNEAALLLLAFLTGLFFFSINKLILSIYYSLHQTLMPTIITVIGTIANFFLNRLLVPKLGAVGIAIATPIASMVQTVLFIFVLYKFFNFALYIKNFIVFLVKYILQLSVATIIFYIAYRLIVKLILLTSYSEFLLREIGLWFWVAPISLLYMALLYLTRKKFGIKLHFLS